MKGLRRLDPIINLHRLRRRVLKQLVASLKAQGAELAGRLEGLGREGMRVRAWNSESLSRGENADRRRLAEAWMACAERESGDLRRRICELAVQIQESEKRLVRASQELKMLSTLQDRRAAREREQAAKREQRDLDEMASHCAGMP